MKARSNLENAELIEQRADERLYTTRLEPYLRDHLDGAEGPLFIEQFHGGKANLTYLLRFGDREFVMRRPPLGPIPPGAHDMRREHRVLSRLYRQFKPAPRSLLLCEDESIIGAVFIVEERRRGFVIRDDIPPEFAGRPDLNRRIGESLIDALGDLHLVNPKAVGLADLGRPDGFVERQLDGWSRRWHAAQGGEEAERAAAEMAPVLDWLGQHLPASGATALLHNDYRLDNCLLDSTDPGLIEAVLDWDMCTQGDPLADLGYILNYWVEPGDDPAWREIAAMPTWRNGFPSRADAVQRYAARTGFDVAAIGWHQVFAAFKLAVIIQQIYIRFVRGQTQDERFRHYYRRVLGLASKARSLARL
ncbi:MAG TPA: phosphotransferase family protein [Stellaceae bacterium]|jgi:aminoglycoside phosphotransferase (APT) family kinase protein|nr:phosphotransferase family protein [Stellaceae bacterium]